MSHLLKPQWRWTINGTALKCNTSKQQWRRWPKHDQWPEHTSSYLLKQQRRWSHSPDASHGTESQHVSTTTFRNDNSDGGNALNCMRSHCCNGHGSALGEEATPSTPRERKEGHANLECDSSGSGGMEVMASLGVSGSSRLCAASSAAARISICTQRRNPPAMKREVADWGRVCESGTRFERRRRRGPIVVEVLVRAECGESGGKGLQERGVGGCGGAAFDISRLEAYTERVRSEVLCVNALVDGEEDQVIVFKGFSSSLMRSTAADPSEPVLPETATVVSIDRIKGPYDPSKADIIEKGLSWSQFEQFLQTQGL